MRRGGRSGRLGGFVLGSLAIGLVLMLVFEATVTRIVGVAALFAFIVAGVFLIADPAFLGEEDEEGASGSS